MLTLKGLATSLLVFGSVLSMSLISSETIESYMIWSSLKSNFALAVFAGVTWNNNSNEILRGLMITGLITIFASIIGLIGCSRCLSAFEVVKVTKMKKSPGQESLLIFFYFNFLLFCSYLLFGTWCFFYQDDVSTWLDAKYSENSETWEKDFKNIKLDTVQ